MNYIASSVLRFWFSSFLALLVTIYTNLNAQEHKNIFGKSYEHESKSIIEGFRDSLKTPLKKIDTTVIIDDSALLVSFYASKDDEISYQIIEGGVTTFNYEYNLINKSGVFKNHLGAHIKFNILDDNTLNLTLLNDFKEKIIGITLLNGKEEDMEINKYKAWYEDEGREKIEVFKVYIMSLIKDYFIIPATPEAKSK